MRWYYDVQFARFRHTELLKIGTDGSWYFMTIALAEIWTAAHPPGSHVAASELGEGRRNVKIIYVDRAHNNGLLYNNSGQLCAPVRQ